MKVPIPRLYLGTMTFGWSQTSTKVDEKVAHEMMNKFIDYNTNKICHDNEGGATSPIVHYIDTARIYASGKTETILGSIFKSETFKNNQADTTASSSSILSIGTKAHPSGHELGLSRQGILAQWEASTKAMQMNENVHEQVVDEYYLHQPDSRYSLLESLQMAHELVQKGQIKQVGMSNFHASEVQRAFDLCDEYKLTKPTVYQGLYNPLNRLVETELIPLLRKYNCRFVAYNPLAAGLLTGKHGTKAMDEDDESSKKKIIKGRFKNNVNYIPRFYTKANFAALERIQTACQEEEVSLLQATFSWLLRHSVLMPQTDGILLGASSLDQLEQNLNACAQAQEEETGSLSPRILQAFDEAWGLTQDSAYCYWRSYSQDMPNRDQLDPGASYAMGSSKEKK